MTLRTSQIRRAAAALFTAAALSAPGAALAEPPRPAALSWVRLPGAETCIGARALAEAVESRLARAALVPMSRAEVSVEGHIAASSTFPRWRVELVVADARGASLGSRHLESDAADCHALDTDLAVTIALLVDPEAVLPARPAPPGNGLPPSSPGDGLPPSSPGDGLPPSSPGNGLPPSKLPLTAAALPPPAPPWSVAFLAGPALSIGLLPSASAGLALRAIVTPPRFWPIEVGGVVWAPSAVGAGSTAASFFLATGSLAACPLHAQLGAFRALACAGVEVGELRAGGFGTAAADARGEPVVQALLEGRLLRRLWGPLTATVGLALAVPFTRARFFYVDTAGAEREVFLASPVAGSGDLSLGVELP